MAVEMAQNTTDAVNVIGYCKKTHTHTHTHSHIQNRQRGYISERG